MCRLTLPTGFFQNCLLVNVCGTTELGSLRCHVCQVRLDVDGGTGSVAAAYANNPMQVSTTVCLYVLEPLAPVHLTSYRGFMFSTQ